MAQNSRIEFGQALRAEFARILHHPGDTIAVVVVNAALMTFVWFVLPRSWFFTFTGPSGYALALAGWTYSDVTASNVLAPDHDLAVAILDDPASLRTVLRAKGTALWLLIAPPCVIIAIICGFFEHDWVYTGFVIVSVAVIPIGALAITSLVGVAFPYHQRPLLWRWENRRRFGPVILRWMILTMAPYVVYPIAATLIVAIPFGIWWLFGDLDASHRVPTWGYAVCIVVACGIAWFCWWWSHRWAMRWVGRHGNELRAYLTDPDRG